MKQKFVEALEDRRRGADLVHRLDHRAHLALRADRSTQNSLRPVPGHLVQVAVEGGLSVGVGNVDGFLRVERLRHEGACKACGVGAKRCG